MSDTQVAQSVVSGKVERCKYGHDWKAYETNEGTRYTCIKCVFSPTRDSKLWHEAQAIIHLRDVLKPGDTVYTVLRHVSRSGMSRRISLCIGTGKEVTNITWHVANALGDSTKNRAGYVQDVGLEVGGCGMDMGFHVVYNLSRTLFPHGFMCTGSSCQSNDHTNDRPPYKFDRKKFVGKIHTGDGGYALRHQWL